MQSKVEIFEMALKDFMNSEKGVQDYIEFLSRFHSVIKQGSGLTWTTIREVLDDVINPKPQLDEVKDYKEGDPDTYTISYKHNHYYERKRFTCKAVDVWEAIDQLNNLYGRDVIEQHTMQVIHSPKEVS